MYISMYICTYMNLISIRAFIIIKINIINIMNYTRFLFINATFIYVCM